MIKLHNIDFCYLKHIHTIDKQEKNMKSYELKPTPENIEFAFKKDLIGRNESLFDFLEFLNSIEDDCSIALEGYWGSGKTFFVKQMEMVIKAVNPFIEMDEELRNSIMNEAYRYIRNYNADKMIKQVPIYYDAWLYDNESDPILSLVYSILETFDSDLIFKNIEFNVDSIREYFNNILSSLHIKLEIPKLVNTEDWLSDIKKSRNIHYTVKEFLDKLLEERGDRLVIFIDELDRCSPEYAVKLLERIKHYFNNDRITFVFSVNLEQLQHTIKSHYGASFEASRYLDRFFDLRLSLPAPNKREFYNMLEFNASDGDYDALINETVLNHFHLEFREILKYVRFLRIIDIRPMNLVLRNLYTNRTSNDYVSAIMIPIMIALRITDIDAYNGFISGKRADVFVDIYSSDSFYMDMFKCILKSDEMFEEYYDENSNKNKVNFKSFLERIYLFIFSNKLEPYYKGEKITINRDAKEYLLKQISLINKSSNPNGKLAAYDE